MLIHVYHDLLIINFCDDSFFAFVVMHASSFDSFSHVGCVSFFLKEKKKKNKKTNGYGYFQNNSIYCWKLNALRYIYLMSEMEIDEFIFIKINAKRMQIHW